MISHLSKIYAVCKFSYFRLWCVWEYRHVCPPFLQRRTTIVTSNVLPRMMKRFKQDSSFQEKNLLLGGTGSVGGGGGLIISFRIDFH